MLELKTIAIRMHGTYSALLWDGDPFAVSVECYPPVLKNGDFECTRDFYHHGGYATYEIQVDGHDRVLFHKGNYGKDSLACVVVAESFAMLDGKVAIADSKHGFEELMEKANGAPQFTMRVSGR
jgi:hypothetical protein